MPSDQAADTTAHLRPGVTIECNEGRMTDPTWDYGTEGLNDQHTRFRAVVTYVDGDYVEARATVRNRTPRSPDPGSELALSAARIRAEDKWGILDDE